MLSGRRPIEQTEFHRRWAELSSSTAAAAWCATPKDSSSPSETACADWFRQLWWSERADKEQKFTGITFLEMLVKIVLVTGSLPPRVIRDATTRVTSTVQLTSSEGILLPANLHDLLSAFVIMVHKVCKRCMWDALKFKHRKIRTLEYLGVGKARKGLLRRPTLPREQETGEMLWKVLSSSSPGEALRDLALAAL